MYFIVFFALTACGFFCEARNFCIYADDVCNGFDDCGDKSDEIDCSPERKAFADFDPEKVARFTKKRVEKLLLDPSIVRNRLKVESTVTNAKAFLAVQEEFGSFSDYIWGFVDGKPIQNKFRRDRDIRATSPESGTSSPSTSPKSVDLPAPFGPTSATRSP